MQVKSHIAAAIVRRASITPRRCPDTRELIRMASRTPVLNAGSGSIILPLLRGTNGFIWRRLRIVQCHQERDSLTLPSWNRESFRVKNHTGALSAERVSIIRPLCRGITEFILLSKILSLPMCDVLVLIAPLIQESMMMMMMMIKGMVKDARKCKTDWL